MRPGDPPDHQNRVWKKLFPAVFLFTCVDGFISNWLYPDRLPLLYRDFLVLGVYLFFIGQEPVGRWVGQLRKRVGPVAWLLAISFLVLGLLQIFNPFSPDLLVGLLGFKVLYFYWPLAVLAYAYVDSLEKARSLLKMVVYLSIPINLFGLYQFSQGPDFLVSTFGPGFERATIMAHIEGISAEESFLRVIGTFASSGQYSRYLLLNGMFCFALMFSTMDKREWLILGGSGVLNFLALLATGSRGGLLLLLAATLIFAVLCRRARRILVVMSFVGLSLYYGFGWMGERVVTRFETLRDVEMIRHRTVETTSAMFVDIFEEYPLGRGLGTANTASRHLLGEGSSGWSMVENYPSKLQVETGIFGVIVFYSFLFVLSVRWLRRWLRSLDGPAADLGRALTALCFTLFVAAVLSDGGLDTPPGSVFVWTIVGIVARFSALSREHTRQRVCATRPIFH